MVPTEQICSTCIVQEDSLNNSSVDKKFASPPSKTQDELCLREWKRSLAWRDLTFAHDDQRQHPHVLRRKIILGDHPNLRKLYGADLSTAAIIIFAVLDQILLCYLFGTSTMNPKLSWFLMLSTAALIGSSIANLTAVAIHECVHGLAISGVLYNKLLALVANIGTPVPIAMSFRRYHSDHHVFQGADGKDPDLPLSWEISLIGGSFTSKLFWVSLYPILYAVRALARNLAITNWEVFNAIFTIFCNLLFLRYCGLYGFLYLLVSFYIGYTFHPLAAHFIQEHFTYNSGQETYSCYSWANTFFLNIGFHIEHHDFPAIPSSRLPLVTLLAPEYYQPLRSHLSWRRVLWTFLVDSNIGPQSRCVRL